MKRSSLLSRSLRSHSLIVIAVTACCFASFTTVQAKESHVHGHGKLLIAQEGQQWHLAFELPAANLLGFEHEAETAAQQTLINEWQSRLQDPQQVFGMAGHCELKHMSVSLPGSEEGEHQEHDDHERDNHEHNEAAGSEHEETEHEEHHHADVDASYELQCDSTVSGIDVKLFAQAPSLQEIEVQWIADVGQGMREITPSSPSVRW